LKTLTYSTVEVAKLLGITSDTLHRWIRERRIVAPPVQTLGKMRIRIWSKEDVAKAKAYKAERYRKGRGRKRKSNR
jgi:excisionase family DNA binding protein